MLNYAFAGYRGRVFVQNFHKATRNADSSSRVGQLGICWSTGPSSRLSALLSSLDWPSLSTGLFCSFLLTVLSCPLSLGPSFPRPLPVSWDISRRSHFCGFRAKTDKGILWLALTHTETNATYRITIIIITSFFNRIFVVNNNNNDNRMRHISAKMNTRLDTTGWEKWSTGNRARNWNLTIWKNGICTTQNPSWIMRRTNSWDFEIQTDHLNSARRPDLMIIW